MKGRKEYPESLLKQVEGRRIVECQIVVDYIWVALDSGATFSFVSTPTFTKGSLSVSDLRTVYDSIREHVGCRIMRASDYGSGFEIEFEDTALLSLDSDDVERFGPEIAVLRTNGPAGGCAVWG